MLVIKVWNRQLRNLHKNHQLRNMFRFLLNSEKSINNFEVFLYFSIHFSVWVFFAYLGCTLPKTEIMNVWNVSVIQEYLEVEITNFKTFIKNVISHQLRGFPVFLFQSPYFWIFRSSFSFSGCFKTFSKTRFWRTFKIFYRNHFVEYFTV